MKKHVTLWLVMVLLSVSCSLSTVPPSPGVPVTGNTMSPLTPTATPQPPNALFPSLTPFHTSALFFDGQDDYVKVEDDPSLDLQNSFTISAWIYLQDYTEWASIVTKGDKPNVNNYAVQQSGPNDPIYRTAFGKLRFSGCVDLSAPLPESQTVLSLRRWYFVAVSFDGSQLRFYLDGKLDGASEVRGPLCTNDSPLYIGVDFPLTTEYWHGVIDELRIWNATRSEIEIQEIMKGQVTAPDSTLVGYWPFDEGSGSIAHDLSGHGNDGLLIGNPVWFNRAAPNR